MFNPSVVIATGDDPDPPGDFIMVAGWENDQIPTGHNGYINPAAGNSPPLGTLTPNILAPSTLITQIANIEEEGPALSHFIVALQGNLADTDAIWREIVITGTFLFQPFPQTFTFLRINANNYEVVGSETWWQFLPTPPNPTILTFNQEEKYGIFINDREPA